MTEALAWYGSFEETILEEASAYKNPCRNKVSTWPVLYGYHVGMRVDRNITVLVITNVCTREGPAPAPTFTAAIYERGGRRCLLVIHNNYSSLVPTQ